MRFYWFKVLWEHFKSQKIYFIQMDNNIILQMIGSLTAAAVGSIHNCEQQLTSLMTLRRRNKERQLFLIQNLLIYRKVIPRSIWVKPHSNGWFDFVVPRMSSTDFYSHFRMSPAIFDVLVDLLEQKMKKQDTKLRKAIDVKKRVAIGINCLSSCSEIKTIAALFGVGKATAQECFDDFVKAVNSIISPKFIKWPSTPNDYKKSADKFEELWQFPMTVAAVDGCHFPVSPPKDKTTDYYNFKGWYSIITFAACDAEGKALYIRSGLPGRGNDSTIFRNSSLFREIMENECLPESNRVINGVRIPYNLLGDSAFRLETWCLKPFVHRAALTADQTRFNFRLSRARRIVENLFGRVKARWRRVLKRQESKVENSSNVIVAAFGMHNFCEHYRVLFDPEWEQEVHQIELINPQPEQMDQINENASANEIRNALLIEFRNNQLGWENL